MNTTRNLVRTIIASLVLFLAGTGLNLYVSAAAREANCENVKAAFAAYTDALIDVSEGPRTPEEQADFDARVERFRLATEPALDNCH